jgi:hypothetical protein
MDIMYMGIAVVLFLSAFGLMRMCDRLGEHKSGDKP